MENSILEKSLSANHRALHDHLIACTMKSKERKEESDHRDRTLITFLYIFQRFFNTISLSRHVKIQRASNERDKLSKRYPTLCKHRTLFRKLHAVRFVVLYSRQKRRNECDTGKAAYVCCSVRVYLVICYELLEIYASRV